MLITPPYIQLYTRNIQMLYLQQHHSILETLEQNNIIINFQCREGYCGICRTSLICGKIKYTKKPLACIQNFEILICCCSPITNIQLKL